MQFSLPIPLILQIEKTLNTPKPLLPGQTIPARGSGGGSSSLTAWTVITVYPKGKSGAGRISNRQSAGAKGDTWVLPIPSDLTDLNSMAYEPTSFSTGQRIATNFIDATLGDTQGDNDVFSALWAGTKKTAVDAYNAAAADPNAALGQLASEFLPEGAANVFLAPAGVFSNPNMEALFKGANLRTFQFSWILTPLKKEDSDSIKTFVKSIKKSIYPTYTHGSGRGGVLSMQTFPAEFVVSFYSSDINGSAKRIFSTVACACTDFTVNYTQNGGFYAHDDGNPTSVNISMSFQEFYTLAQDDIDAISSE